MLSTGRRRGFTLVEVVVTTIVVAIIAAMLGPSLAGYYNDRRASETAATLNALGLALNNPVWIGNTGFVQTVTRYPQQLHHLTVKIVATTDKQCSGAGYTTTQAGSWRSSPPYTFLNITDAGVATPLGRIRDSVVKGTAANGTVGFVELHMDSVSLADAQTLDLKIDNAAGAAAGLLRYANSSTAGFQFIRYLVSAPIFRRSGTGPDSTTGCY